MAKQSSVIKNEKRKKLSASHFAKRKKLKDIVMNQDLPFEERIVAQMKLSELPRNGAKTRVRNRCGLTGRPRSYYRDLGISRIALRELGSIGMIPGMIKSSW